MAFNLYQPEEIGAPIKEAFTKSYNKLEGRAKQMFGGAQGERVRGGGRAELNRDMIMEAIETFGMETFLNWDRAGGEIVKQIEGGLKEAKQGAIQARGVSNVQDYARSLSQKLYDQRAQAYAQAMEEMKRRQIISGILGFLSSLGGGIIGGLV